LQRALDARFVRFVDRLAAQKRENRDRLRADPAARRAAMIAAAEGFDLDVTARYPAWFEEEEASWHPLRS